MNKENSPYLSFVHIPMLAGGWILYIIKMSTFLRNTMSRLYNAVTEHVAATRDALAERLHSVRETASLLYNRMMDNMGYGQEKLKDIVEKEAEKEAKEQQQEEDNIDLTRQERTERSL